MMKPSCSWCKDYEQFEENKQLSILVNCYKKLCEYITQTALARDIIEAVDCSSDILALLNDGSLFGEETEKPSDSSFTLCLTAVHVFQNRSLLRTSSHHHKIQRG